MLSVFSPYEIAMTKAAQKRTWEAFLERGTSHSGNASTLPYVIRRCEQEGVGYKLTALPGRGYYIEPKP